MKKFKVILLLLMPYLCFAQVLPTRPYEQLQSEQLDPKWYTTFVDNDIASDVLDGYNHFDDNQFALPIIHNDKVYTISNTSFLAPQIGGITGYYVSCHDLNTGVLIWQNRYSVNDGDDHAELPRSMIIDEKGDLLISGQIQIAPYQRQFFSTDLVLFRRILELGTGHQVHYYHPAFDDANAVQTSYLSQGRIARMFFERINANEYRIIDPIFAPDSTQTPYKGFIVSTIDSLGYLKRPQTIINSKYNNYHFILNVVGKDSLQYCEVDIVDGEFVYVMRYFDISDGLEELDEMRTLLNVNFLYFIPQEISPDGSKVLYTVRNLVLVPRFDITFAYYSISNSGVVKKLIELSSTERLNIQDWYSASPDINFIKLEIQQAVSDEKKPSSIKFVSYTDGIIAATLDSIRFVDSLRIGNPYWSVAIPGTDDVLALWSEQALRVKDDRIVEDEGGVALSMMRYPKSVLRTYLTKVEDDRLLTTSKNVSIFPNPSMDFIVHPHIVSDEAYTIVSMDGTQLLGTMIGGRIDVSSLTSGLYTLRVISNKILYVSKFIKN